MSATVSFTRARLSADDREELRAWLACAPDLPLLTAEQEATATPDQLVEHNLRLACRVACKYAGRGVPVSDLIQEASIGLMRAAKTFDASKGRFSTYAVKAVKEYVLRATHNAGSTIRVPVHVHTDRPETRPETVAAAELVRSVDSLNRIISHDKASDLRDQTLESVLPAPDDTEAQALDNVERQEQQQRMITALAHLTERQEAVMIMYYGLDGHAPQNAGQIGRRLRLSRERVRQILEGARHRLRRIYGVTDTSIRAAGRNPRYAPEGQERPALRLADRARLTRENPMPLAASGYRGVSSDKWSYKAKIGAKADFIMSTKCKHAAARAYNAESRKRYGANGYQNDVPPCNCADCARVGVAK